MTWASVLFALQGAPDPTQSTLYQIGEVFYVVLLAYLVIYLVFFIAPLVPFVWPRGFNGDLKTLKAALEEERNAGEREEEALAEKLLSQIKQAQEELEQLRLLAEDAEEAGEHDEAEEIRTHRIPKLEREWEALNERLDEVSEEAERDAVARLEHIEAFQRTYTHPFVSEAVAQLRSRFPRADYQRFEIDLLPSLNTYAERVSMARVMAGVFVLVGLLGTMIKLDGVVDSIRALTDAAEMEPGVFLSNMGQLMQGIGGAFDNSIYGIILMVVFLILVGLISSWVQRSIDRLDTVVAKEVVPSLLDLHNRYMPLRGTQSQLDRLNESVGDLSNEMMASLQRFDSHVADMGTRISDVLKEFGSHEQYYVTLNNWVKTLETSTGELQAAAGTIKGATQQLGQPINEMNATLRDHLQMQANYSDSGYIDLLLQQINDTLEQSVRRSEKQITALSEESGSTLTAMSESNQRQIKALMDQSGAVEKQMKETAEALRASSPERLSSVLDRLERTTAAMHEQMDRTSTSLTQASANLEQYSQAPTFFSWVVYTAYPTVRDWVLARLGKSPRGRGGYGGRAYSRRRLSGNGHRSVSQAGNGNAPKNKGGSQEEKEEQASVK